MEYRKQSIFHALYLLAAVGFCVAFQLVSVWVCMSYARTVRTLPVPLSCKRTVPDMPAKEAPSSLVR